MPPATWWSTAWRRKTIEHYVGEATVPHSFLKAPYFKQAGYPDGIFRVGPLARLNVVARCGTELADAEFDEYHQRYGKVVQSSFHYHHARLIEILYCIERMEQLLQIRRSWTGMCAHMPG